MKILTEDLDQVAGGSSGYEVGYAVGSAIRTFFDGFVRAGSLYTATL